MRHVPGMVMRWRFAIVRIVTLTAISLSAAAAAAQVGVLTHRYDNARTGQNTAETVLTPGNVAPGTFARLFTYAVDGAVYAQPLYAPSVNVPGLGNRNLVFVGTQHNSVYAFDADSSVIGQLWRASFINPALGVTTVPAADVAGSLDPALDITPEIGIAGTPVIDPLSGTLYVVAKTKEIVGGQAHYVHRLHALDIATGAEKFGGPVVIADATLSGGISAYVSGPVSGASAFDAVSAVNRAALLLVNGVVYVAWGAHGDAAPYHGWVTAHDAHTLTLTASFNVTPNGALGGIWMAGGGPAADAAGSIYLSTGAGTFDVTGITSPAYGNSVLRFAPGGGLSVGDFFTPWNQAVLSAAGIDLSSSGVLLLPDQGSAPVHLMVAAGEDGNIYLIDRDHLGGYQGCGLSCNAVVQVLPLGSSPFGTPAYFNGRLYYQGAGDVLKAFQLTGGALALSSQSSTPFAFPGASPTVSANGAASGVVWTLQIDGYATGAPAVLRAHDAADLSHELYNSGVAAADQLGSGVKYSMPVVANGKVFAGTQNGLAVFGLVSSLATAPTNLGATAVSFGQINLAWTGSAGSVAGYRVERCQGAGCTSFAPLVLGVSGTAYNDVVVAAGTTYRYRVQAMDTAGGLTAFSNVATATTPADDVSPPTAPINLTATATSTSQINLAWTASTDNTGVTGYFVERCQGAGCASFAQIAAVTGATYSSTGLAPTTSYSYRVRAVDAAGNPSGYSGVASATTQAPPAPVLGFVQGRYSTPQAPTASVAVTYTAAQSAGNLNVVIVGVNNATSTVTSVSDTMDNVYELAVGPTVRPGPAEGGGITQWIYYAMNISGAPAGTNTVTVAFAALATLPDVRILEYSGVDGVNDPFDGATANVGSSVTSDSGPLTTTNARDLLVAGNTVLTWAANAGSFTPRLFTSPNGDLAADQFTTTAGTYQATSTLGHTGPWVMQMVAFRAGGSPPPPPDVLAPTTPAALTATSGATRQVNLAWGASSDNVAVAAYLIERCQGSGCTDFTQIAMVTGLVYVDSIGVIWSTRYSYRVRAMDGAGNLSGFSNTATATTPPPDVVAPTIPGNLVATVGGVGLGGQIVLDSSGFNDPAENPLSEGGRWAPLTVLAPGGGRLQKSSGVTYPQALNTAFTDHGGARTTTPIPADQYSQIVVGAVDQSFGNVGPIARVQTGAGNLDAHYLWWVGNANRAVYRVDSNGVNYSAATLALNVPVAAAGDVARLIARGGAIYGTLNGKRAFFAWDTALATGQTGLLVFPGGNLVANTVDAWETGTQPPLAAGSGSGLWDSSTFTGPDETTPGGLDESDRWYIPDNVPGVWRVGGRAIGSNAGAHSFAANWRIQPPANQYAQVTLASVGSGGGAGPMVRMSRGARTGYLLFISSQYQSGVYKWTGGQNFQLLMPFTPSRIQAGDTWGLYANGASLDVKLNGVSVGGPFPINNSELPTGDVGFEILGTEMSVDAWEGGTLAGPGTPQIGLSWTASTDNVGVTAYLVERCQGASCSNFAQVASVTTTNFNNTGLAAGTSYSYRVRSRDAAGNFSGYSNTATAATPSNDATPPTAPSGLTATAASTTQINLAWTGATDNIGVTGYLVERCQGAGCTSFAQIASLAGSARTYNNTGLTPNTAYIYRVRATDAAANLSTYSNNSAATTPAPDTTPPTAPSNLTPTASAGQIKLTWTASTDNLAVTAYLVERCQNVGCSNFTQIASVTTTTYTNTGLAAQALYNYRVRARDAANNLSPYSNVVTSVVPGIGFVQVKSATPNPVQTSVTVTYTAAQRAGDLNVVIVGWNDATSSLTSISDTRGNVYVPAIGPTVRPGPTEGGGLTQIIYYAKNIVAAPASGNAVTVTFSAPATLVDVRILEYGGIDTVNPLDGAVAQVGTGDTSDSGPLTTTSPNTLLVAGNMVTSSTATVGAGFTSRVITPDGDIAEDRVVATAGTYQATNLLNGIGAWLMQMVAFKAAP